MFKIPKKPKKIDFLLENKHYRKLHLYIYLVSVFTIVGVYFLIIAIFNQSNIIITGLISILIGLYLVFKRDEIVKVISTKLQEKKLKTRKAENKANLKSTIRKITPKPKRNISLKIGGSLTLKDKYHNLKNKFNKKTKKSQEYIEIK